MSLRIKAQTRFRPSGQGQWPQLKLSCVLLCCVLLGACGFHLRGMQGNVSGITQLAVSCASTDAWTLCNHLKQTLQLHDITLNEEATIRLGVSDIRQDSRALSLQPNASAAELGLSSEITYQLINTVDETVLHEQTIRINNSYRHESSALLAKDRERDDLQTQLSRQLAEEVVRQISVLDSSNWQTQNNNEHKPNKQGQ